MVLAGRAALLHERAADARDHRDRQRRARRRSAGALDRAGPPLGGELAAKVGPIISSPGSPAPAPPSRRDRHSLLKPTQLLTGSFALPAAEERVPGTAGLCIIIRAASPIMMPVPLTCGGSSAVSARTHSLVWTALPIQQALGRVTQIDCSDAARPGGRQVSWWTGGPIGSLGHSPHPPCSVRGRAAHRWPAASERCRGVRQGGSLRYGHIGPLQSTFRHGSTGSSRSTPVARWCRSSSVLSSFVIP